MSQLVSEAQRFWMRHSWYLDRARLHGSLREMSRNEVRRLKWLMEAKARVLTLVERDVLPDGRDAVVFRYMVAQADAHIKYWYSRRPHTEFMAVCKTNRERLWRELRELADEDAGINREQGQLEVIEETIDAVTP